MQLVGKAHPHPDLSGCLPTSEDPADQSSSERSSDLLRSQTRFSIHVGICCMSIVANDTQRLLQRNITVASTFSLFPPTGASSHAPCAGPSAILWFLVCRFMKFWIRQKDVHACGCRMGTPSVALRVAQVKVSLLQASDVMREPHDPHHMLPRRTSAYFRMPFKHLVTQVL